MENLIRIYQFEDFNKRDMIEGYWLDRDNYIAALESLKLFMEVEVEGESYRIISFSPTVGDDKKGSCNCVDVNVEELYE